MDFLEVKLSVTPEGIEILTGLLYQCGITGLLIEDEKELAQFLADNSKWDYVDEGYFEDKLQAGSAILFYVPNNVNGKEILLTAENEIKKFMTAENHTGEYGTLQLTYQNIKEEDWANNWKQYFKPLPIGEKFIIKPSWEEYHGEDKTVLAIDPGHIFGTGTHETTQMCLEAIEKAVQPGSTVLDLGCGSGILAIGSLLLKAGKATAVDIDPNAVQIVTENAKLNGVQDHIEVLAADILSAAQLQQKFSQNPYDIVLANIIADVIIPLCPLVKQFLKPEGVFIASGIINTRLDDVKNALALQQFTISEIYEKGDWVAIVSRR